MEVLKLSSTFIIIIIKHSDIYNEQRFPLEMELIVYLIHDIIITIHIILETSN